MRLISVRNPVAVAIAAGREILHRAGNVVAVWVIAPESPSARRGDATIGRQIAVPATAVCQAQDNPIARNLGAGFCD